MRYLHANYSWTSSGTPDPNVFSTGSFLNGFNANPSVGNIKVPIVDGQGLTSEEFTDDRADEVTSMVNAVVSEARGLSSYQAQSVWKEDLPYDVPSTAGEFWFMHPMRRGDEFSYDEGVVFKSQAGKHVSLWNDKYKPTIGVGYSGKYATAYQKVRIDKKGDGGGYTSNYFMSFVDLGIHALARRFDRAMWEPDLFMCNLAMALAHLVYVTGPYSRQQLMKPPQMRCDGVDHDLVAEVAGGFLGFPHSLSRDNKELSISISKEETPSAAGTISARVDLVHDRILMHISRRRDHPTPLMPLGSDLSELWEGARILAQADPDDGGYLASIM